MTDVCKCGRVGCPLAYANVKGRAAYKGHSGFKGGLTPREVIAMAFELKKPAPGSPAVVPPRACDRDFEKQYPAVFQFLSSTSYGDGSPRKTSTLFIFIEDGVFKVCLNDRDVGRLAFVSQDSFEGLLGALEACLVDESVVWRAPSGGRQKGR